ncbi:hypothetical protein PV326_002000 [Microctonus aethiopoides]|nr:hypothetical protein PV326_002000 [Microctonus aethiopoides]
MSSEPRRAIHSIYFDVTWDAHRRIIVVLEIVTRSFSVTAQNSCRKFELVKQKAAVTRKERKMSNYTEGNTQSLKRNEKEKEEDEEQSSSKNFWTNGIREA